MKILRRRPSPAMAVALAALVVALGGVAFATIPDSSGTFHGCVANGNGNLRVVEGAADCGRNERAISWNQQGPAGPPGQGVVARLRSGPVEFPTFEPPAEVPLSPNSWQQGADEFQRLEIELTVPDQFGCTGRVNIVLDGQVLQAYDLFQLFGTERKVFYAFPLFEPGSTKHHTLTMQLRPNGGCRRLESVKVDVLGYR